MSSALLLRAFYSFLSRFAIVIARARKLMNCSVRSKIDRLHRFIYGLVILVASQSYFVSYPNVMSIQKMSEIVNVPMVKITIFKLGSNEEPKSY